MGNATCTAPMAHGMLNVRCAKQGVTAAACAVTDTLLQHMHKAARRNAYAGINQRWGGCTVHAKVDHRNGMSQYATKQFICVEYHGWVTKKAIVRPQTAH